MYRISKMLFLILLFVSATTHAQTVLLDESLTSPNSFNTFTTVSASGLQFWINNTNYGAVCSGYAGGQSFQNEDWLISPAMNFPSSDEIKLTFSHTRGNAAVMNVGVSEGWYKAYATANYSGDPSTTNWVELSGMNQNVTAAWQYVSSGQLTIPEQAKSPNSRIAFRYISSDSESATWEIKNVKVTSEPMSTTAVFKITNWNVEWLGCSTFGPANETLQINNVASVMLSLDSDIYCLQEVSNTDANPSVATLVSLMGSTQWGGAIVPSNTGDCVQRQALIYKKARVQLMNALELSSGIPSQGNSYYYNWTNGRFPAVYNVNLIAGGNLIPVVLVNIHSKAEDGNAMSYTRRLGASEGLKNILDNTTYNSKNVIVVGDFNDYLVGTTSDACLCTNSPFKNFMDDTAHYAGITQDMTDIASPGNHPIIENMIVSNELAGNYVANSAVQNGSAAESVLNYNYTTSNHLPVTAQFAFPLLETTHFGVSGSSIGVYPNPTKGFLTIQYSVPSPLEAVVFDMTGRVVLASEVHDQTLEVSSLPAGLYILKIGNNQTKFIKE